MKPDKHSVLKKQVKKEWVYNGRAMEYRIVNHIPLLYNIFDEILMSILQPPVFEDHSDALHVNIEKDKRSISIRRYGVIFPIHTVGFDPWKSLLRTNRSNIQDQSIFSRFIIRTYDGQHKYKMVFYDEPRKKKIVKTTNHTMPCTSVAFNLSMDCVDLEDDILAIIRKKVVDMAVMYGEAIKVELDGHKLDSNFLNYVDLYLQSSKNTSERIHQILDNDWEVCVSLSPNGVFHQLTIINEKISYAEVSAPITSIIEKGLTSALKKKRNEFVQRTDVKRHLWVFIKGKDFPDSLTPAIDWAVNDELEKFVRQVVAHPDSFIYKEVYRCALKNALALEVEKKVDANIEAIPKFEDATSAGGVDSLQCTLIITEGDSAKSLANVGLSVHGRKLYGVFAIKGKFLNVRQASLETILNNEEINNLRKIIGLDYKKDYYDRSDLRYGQIMIMTDQDNDGYHIKGLLINFFHFFWPSLVKIPSFLSELITPLIKVTNDRGITKDFYTQSQYNSWESITDISRWTVKYYKGLGTSTLKEGMQYFRYIDDHRVYFLWEDEEDTEALEKAFSKSQVNERKSWILEFKHRTFIPRQSGTTRICDFINHRFILYSEMDLIRSIPSMVDGLKPVQRKILFSAFKKHLTKEMKVAQFSGYVSECCAYHHGEENISNTIVGMAQNFVGSNNINLLRPNGQFGTRLEGGKDAASSRYICTELSSITRTIFNENDDILLHYMHEDGQSVEPVWYLPILPMILVNGCKGIGTGWSTKVPSYNPQDIVRNLKSLLQGENMEELKPWSKHFHGEVESVIKEGYVTYISSGIIDIVDRSTLKIRELPMGISMHTYENKLKSFKFIKKYEKKIGGNDVEIDIHLHEDHEHLTQLSKENLLKMFKLKSSVPISNMHLRDSHGTLKKYDSPEQILKEFYELRLDFYEKRRGKLLEKSDGNLKMAQNKVRFIKDCEIGEINLYDSDKEELCRKLKDKGFEEFEGAKCSYDYLLLMPIVNLTAQMVEGLKAECLHQEKIITKLQETTAKNLWLEDLHAFEKVLDVNVLSDAQRTALFTDLESLTGTKWITHGVIQRIFAIFSETTFTNKKILFLTQGKSTASTMDMDDIARLPLLNYSLVFIPLKSPMRDGGVHFSLLVLYSSKKGTHKFHHYDIVGTINRNLAESLAESIQKVIPAFGKVDVYDALLPDMLDQHDCGVWVLAITEVICQWFINSEASTHVSHRDSLMNKVKDLREVEVYNMRMKYCQMILNHEAEKLSLRDFQVIEELIFRKEQHGNLRRKRNVPTNEGVTEDVGHLRQKRKTTNVPISKGATENVDHVTNIASGTRSAAQVTELLIDLQSLSAKNWLTDGAIDRMFTIFESNFKKEDKILLFRQATSASIRQNPAAITSYPLLQFALVFIPLNSAQMHAYRSDDGAHYSLLVLDNTTEGRHMFRHYDTLGSANTEVARDIAQIIREEIPDVEEVSDAFLVAEQQDSYNCGVYVLAITEAIYKWYVENEKSALELMGRVKIPVDAEHIRKRYYQLILDHERFQDPGYM